MSTILDEIIQKKRQDFSHIWKAFDKEKTLEKHKQNISPSTSTSPSIHTSTEQRIPTPLRVDTQQVNTQQRNLKLIAEIKQASPSQDIICKDFNPKGIAKQYATAGADAVSVLTEQHYFKGSLQDLATVRKEITLPLLRKDFIVDCYQVYQAYTYGADIVLLIVAVLDDAELRSLYDYICGFGMQVLIEVHTQQELERVLSVFSEAELKDNHTLLGINNRDLHTFSVDLRTTEAIAKHIPTGIPIVAESGIFNKQDALFVRDAGAHVLLVGQGILQHNSIADIIKELTCIQ